jgi:2-keto-4-pentenoate hydratase
MLTADQIEQAARHLLHARETGRAGPRLPESCRPAAPDDALAIQRRVQALLGATTGGWKCSLPAPERPVSFAPIFGASIARTSPCAVPARAAVARIEPEVAWVLGRDLAPRAEPYREDEVRAAIAEVRLVLEILGSRYADPGAVGFAELLADHVSNAGLFIGPRLDDAFSHALEGFSIAVDGPSAALHRREGRHPDGHPLRPLVWLASYLAHHRDAGKLEAGQIVTTGSYAGALDVPVGIPLSIAFGALGTIDVELKPAR